jgi:hypothetical protein
MSRRDELKLAIALIGCNLAEDDEGQRVIREHTDPDVLIDGLLKATAVALRIMAERDNASPADVVATLQATLRVI